MTTRDFLALDLGASSGRGIVGRFDGKRLQTQEVHRFAHELCRVRGTAYWDVLYLYQQCLHAIAAAKTAAPALAGVGIDTWGLDYGLLDERGRLLDGVISYRNATDETVRETWKVVSDRELFETTGVGHLVFNTVYQLMERRLRDDTALRCAKRLLLLPDLLAYFLTGEQAAEYTDACTTMLLDCGTKTWSAELLERLGLRTELFGAIQYPGQLRGMLLSEVLAQTGFSHLPLYTVAAHDTASAIAAVPAETDDFIYISSGTWSLIGMESNTPILSPQAFAAGYSNEGSLQGAFRLNRNIMGLGLIQECRKAWNAAGQALSWDDIVRAAELAEPFGALIDPDDQELFDLRNIPEKIRSICARRGERAETVGQVARCVYESLALKYRWYVEQLQKITGRSFSAVHIVGGGSKNALLNQFTADAAGLPVIAGPAEGASMANILTQAIAVGELKNISELRAVIRASEAVRRFEPQQTQRWSDAYGKYVEQFNIRSQ